MDAAHPLEHVREELAAGRTEALLLHRPAMLDTRREKRSFERFVGRVWLPVSDEVLVSVEELSTIQIGEVVFVDLAEVLIAEGHGERVPP